jgi:hypothetical protein
MYTNYYNLNKNNPNFHLDKRTLQYNVEEKANENPRFLDFELQLVDLNEENISKTSHNRNVIIVFLCFISFIPIFNLLISMFCTTKFYEVNMILKEELSNI